MGEVRGLREDGGDVLGALPGGGILAFQARGCGNAFGAVDCDAGRDVIGAQARARPIA